MKMFSMHVESAERVELNDGDYVEYTHVHGELTINGVALLHSVVVHEGGIFKLSTFRGISHILVGDGGKIVIPRSAAKGFDRYEGKIRITNNNGCEALVHDETCIEFTKEA